MTEPLIQHLSGTLYKVHNSIIKVASEANIKEKGVGFYNPRNVVIGGKQISKGFSVEEMQQLRECIKNEGLHHPLLLSCKKEGDDLVLLSGERRYRCIQKLIADNEKVFSYSEGWVLASKLYEYIECRIFYAIDIKTMFQYAYTSNDAAEMVGDVANVSLIKYWYDNGFTDADVAQMTQSSLSWVKDTKKIISLDEKCFNSFLLNEINRTVALHLANIDSIEERHIKLDKSKELATKRIAALKEKIQIKLKDAEKNKEIAEAIMADSVVVNSKKLADIAKNEMAKASESIKKHTEELKNIKPIKVKAKDYDEEYGVSKSLSLAKIEKYWIPQAKEIIKDGKNKRYAAFVLFLLEEGVIGGEKDLNTLIHGFKAKCGV